MRATHVKTLNMENVRSVSDLGSYDTNFLCTDLRRQYLNHLINHEKQAMKTLFTFITFLLSTVMLSGQNLNTKIAGNIRDAGNLVLPGATVRMLGAIDSTLILGEITDANGNFQFVDMQYGVYKLVITTLGQKTFVSSNLTIDENHRLIVLPVIILQPSKDIRLNEVTIVAKKPLMVQEIDKTVVNVEAMISAATSNSLEVLEKTPGVSINSSGEISLNGRSGVMVLIDGRSTYMSGQDLAAYLKSLPGGSLEKIELIDNPSAKYDASGNAIINLRLKKNRVGGFTGNVAIGGSAGRYFRNNNALNLNYRYKKVNVFGNLGYNAEKNYNTEHYDRKFYSSGGLLHSSADLVNKQIYKNTGGNINLGVDFAASAKTTYGLIFNLNGGKRNGTADYNSKNYDAQNVLNALAKGSTLGGEDRLNKAVNFNMQHKFGTNGSEIIADANYLNYHTQGNQLFQNNIYAADGVFESGSRFRYFLPSDINIYAAKADYVRPLKNKAKIEAGFKTSLVKNDYVFDYYDKNGESESLIDSRSDHFRYHENINGAYVNGQKTWSRLAAQFGLRLENTRATGFGVEKDFTENVSFRKNYSQLFPSIFLSYKLDKDSKNTLTLMGVRRINRPNYLQLNPFVFFRDQYTYSAGNSALNPQYQNRLELKFQHKQFLNMGLSYNKFTDLIFQTTQAVDSVFTTRPENIATGYMMLLNTSLSFSPAKWWYMNSTLRLSRNVLKGKAYGENLGFGINVARFEWANYFTISKAWGAELGGYYASRDFNGQMITTDMFRLNASVQKKIWKGKGSIRISAEDIFHTWVYHNRSVGIRQSSFVQSSWSDTQRIGFAITRQFGKETFARKRRYNNNGTDEEKERVNN